MEKNLNLITLQLNLKRIFFDPNYTMGTLKNCVSDTSEEDLCYCIEPPKTSKQLIPAGIYKVIINHSPRFNRDLPLLLDVKGFEGIRIHRGNTSKDTKGCILVGELYVQGYVKNSGSWETKIINLIRAYKECFISIS